MTSEQLYLIDQRPKLMGINFKWLSSLLLLKCTIYAQGLANCCTHENLTFFALQSDVDDILHQWHSRMVNIALFYVHNYSHYVNMGLVRIIGLT